MRREHQLSERQWDIVEEALKDRIDRYSVLSKRRNLPPDYYAIYARHLQDAKDALLAARGLKTED